MDLSWGLRSFSPPRSSNLFWLGLVVSGDFFFQVFVRVIAVEVSARACVLVCGCGCLGFLSPLFLLNIMIRGSPACSRKEKKVPMLREHDVAKQFLLWCHLPHSKEVTALKVACSFLFSICVSESTSVRAHSELFKPKVLCPHPKSSFCLSGILVIGCIGNGRF
jgi:hypothetical protein